MQHFTSTIEFLKYNWRTLLQPFQVEPNLEQKVFGDLVTAYSSPVRFYHTLEHIRQVLEKIEQMRQFSINFPVLQFAAWFHDVIYNPKLKDNEEKSAEYAEMVLSSIKIPQSIIIQVKNLILITKTHKVISTDIDSQIFVDADLAIFGSTEREYQIYTESIRQEYSWVPEVEYRIGRKQVLQSFLQGERIFLTEYCLASLEDKARQNLQSELIQLASC
jgi:predicted metal-dependent HD superfamily phosphohydrolase